VPEISVNEHSDAFKAEYDIQFPRKINGVFAEAQTQQQK